jgi:ATP-dependent Clp protease protease subunit
MADDLIISKTPRDIFSKLLSKRILFLGEELTGEIASDIAASLLWLDSESNEEIVFYINSPGGDIENGLLPIYDTFQVIKSPVKTITIGKAMSAAAVLLAAGKKGSRFAFPHAQIMIHGVQVGGELFGDADEFKKESKLIDKLNQSLMEILSKHSNQPLRKIKRDCKTDKYLSAQEAVEYGLIDGIYQ